MSQNDAKPTPCNKASPWYYKDEKSHPSTLSTMIYRQRSPMIPQPTNPLKKACFVKIWPVWKTFLNSLGTAEPAQECVL
jgi:hypothetical protein